METGTQRDNEHENENPNSGHLGWWRRASNASLHGGYTKMHDTIGGKPLIYWTLTWLRDYGFNHLVLGVAYRKETVIEYVRENPIGVDVDFSEHTQEGETGEGFRLAIERHVNDEDFLAMNGDAFTNMNLEKF